MSAFRRYGIGMAVFLSLGTAAWLWDQCNTSSSELDEDLMRMGGSLFWEPAFRGQPYYELQFHSVKEHLSLGSGLGARSIALSLIDSLTEQGVTERLPEAKELLAQAVETVEKMSDDEIWAIVEITARNQYTSADLMGSSYEALLRSQRSNNQSRLAMASKHICIELTKVAKGTQDNLEPYDPTAGEPAPTAEEYEEFVQRARKFRLKAIHYCIQAFDLNEALHMEAPSNPIWRRLESTNLALTWLFDKNGEPDKARSYQRRIAQRLSPLRLALELRKLGWMFAAVNRAAETDQQQRPVFEKSEEVLKSALILAEMLGNRVRLRVVNVEIALLLEQHDRFSEAQIFYQAAYDAALMAPEEDSKLIAWLAELVQYPPGQDPLRDLEAELANLPVNADLRATASIQSRMGTVLHRRKQSQQAFSILQAALLAYQELDDQRAQADILKLLREVVLHTPSVSPERNANTYLEEALALYEKLDDRSKVLALQYKLAMEYFYSDNEKSLKSFEILKEMAIEQHNLRGHVAISLDLSRLYEKSDPSRALNEAMECQSALERAEGDLLLTTAHCLTQEGKLLIVLQRMPEACSPLRRASEIYSENAYPLLEQDVEKLLKRAHCETSEDH